MRTLMFERIRCWAILSVPVELDSFNLQVSLDYYRRESKKIVDIYKELLPAGGEIGKNIFMTPIQKS